MTWAQYKLGELCEIARGGSPRPIDKFITEDVDGINWVKIGDASRSKKYIYETKEKIIKEGVSRSRFVSEGDFLLSNSMSFGRPYIMRTSGCIHDGWLVLSKYQKHLDIDFFYYLLSSPLVVNQFEALAQGSTVRNLNKELVSRVEVKVPSLATQQKIVAKLDAIFAEIDKATAAAEANAKNAEALFQSYLTQVFEFDGECGRSVALGDVCKTSAGGTPLKAKKEYYEGGAIPWLLSGEVCRKEIFSARNFITTKGVENSSAKIFPKDTTLIAMYGATAGQVSILRFPAATNQAVCGILPNKNYTPEFLYYFLSFYKETLLLEVSGVAQPNLSQVKIKNVPLPLMDINQQNELVYKLDEISIKVEQATKSYKNKVVDLTILKQSILKQAFSGELVRE